MSESTSIVSSRNRDCMGCRLISGSGLIGAGLYIAYHSLKLQKTIGKTIVMGIAGSKIFIYCHLESLYQLNSILFFYSFSIHWIGIDENI